MIKSNKFKKRFQVSGMYHFYLHTNTLVKGGTAVINKIEV